MCIVRILPKNNGKALVCWKIPGTGTALTHSARATDAADCRGKREKTVPLSTRHPAVESHVVTFQMMTLTKLWCH